MTAGVFPRDERPMKFIGRFAFWARLEVEAAQGETCDLLRETASNAGRMAGIWSTQPQPPPLDALYLWPLTRLCLPVHVAALHSANRSFLPDVMQRVF